MNLLSVTSKEPLSGATLVLGEIGSQGVSAPSYIGASTTKETVANTFFSSRNMTLINERFGKNWKIISKMIKIQL